mmetsp:Transcript_126948/g.283849  ORF Transcript_126948/g.283849 Transcript_126948/m.283849 type:complete len:649 (-) Transcript_126948:113-2059(-)
MVFTRASLFLRCDALWFAILVLPMAIGHRMEATPSVMGGQTSSSFQEMQHAASALSRISQSLTEGPQVLQPHIDDEVNAMIGMFWPHISASIEHLLKTDVLQLLQGLPGMGKVSFKSLDLHTDEPAVQLVEVRKTDERNVRLTVRFDHRVKKEVALQMGRVVVGIKNMRVAGDAVVRFDSILNTFPIVGGIALQCADLPRISYDLTGIASPLSMPGINGFIRGAIDSVISQYLMGANRFAFAWSDAVNISALRHPPPVGLLRVTAGDGVDLRSAVRKKAVATNTQIQVRLGGETDKFSANTKLQLDRSTVDFLAWDEGQRIYATVFEKKAHRALSEPSTFLGTTQAVPLRDVLKRTGPQELQLFDDSVHNREDGATAKAVSTGLTLGFQMLNLVPTKQGDVFVLRVQVDTIQLPSSMGSSAKVIVMPAGATASASTSPGTVQHGQNLAETELANIVFKLDQKGMSKSDIAEVVNVDEHVVQTVLRRGSSDELVSTHVELSLDSILYIPIEPPKWNSEVEIIVASPLGDEIARGTQRMSSLPFGNPTPRRIYLDGPSCMKKGHLYEPDMPDQPKTTERTPEACQRRCNAVAGCAHFTYWKVARTCHLQNAEATLQRTIWPALTGPPRCLGVDVMIGLSLMGTVASTEPL